MSTSCTRQPATFALLRQGRRRWLLPALLLALCGLWLVTPQTAYAQTIITVDAGAPGPVHDGLSWTTAYTTVQDALDVTNTNSGTTYEVWVAEGTYYPDEGGAHVDNEVSESFRIAWDNVQIYGGFAATETLRTQRNWTAHPTILSGDIDQDGTPANNAWHIFWLDGVTNAPLTTTTVIDGFTVTGGNAADVESADGYGGGLYCDGNGSACSPTLTNLIFSDNRARQDGGAVYNNGRYDGDSSPTLTNVVFRDNDAQSAGGGMANAGSEGGFSSPELTNVTFSGNTARYGGGMANIGYNGDSNPMLINVTFSGNLAGTGGGMYNEGVYGFSSPALINVLFHGNIADGGGGMANIGDEGDSSPELTNVTFSDNMAVEYGGGIYSSAYLGTSSSALENCVLWGNAATISGTQLYNDNGAIATIRYSTVQDGHAGAGNLDSDPRFVAPIDASSAPTTTGDYRLRFGSPAIDAGNNLSVTVATDLDSAPRIQHGTVDMGAYEAAPQPLLALAKQVAPASDVPYRSVVTYTLTLSNTGNLTDTAIFTDALPAQVSFGGWLANPGATQTAGQITWSGTITPAAALTYIFTATHTGAANIAVTNTAYYSGVRQAGQAAAAFTTIKAATTLTLTSAPNPSLSGQSITFTATVTVNPPGAGTPTGVVTFTMASGVLGTGNLTGGVASFSTASLPGGSHLITATYGGDANFAGSLNSLTQTVRHQVQVTATPAAGGSVTGGGLYAHAATAVVTATASTGYTFTAWTSAGGALATTPVYSFPVTRTVALTATFAPLPQPLAYNDAAGVLEGEEIDVGVLANDHDPAGGGLTVVALTPLAHGVATIHADGERIHYAAALGFSGVVSVTYTVRDVNGQQSSGLAVIVVTALAETDGAPQLALITATVQSTQHFTSPQATATAALPANFFTGAITPTQVFFLSYTPVVTATAPTQTPPATLTFAHFEFELLAYLDDHAQPGAFAQPIGLTIRYNPAILGEIDPATLGLFLWDGSGWGANGVTIVSRDSANGVLTVALSYLGDFALFGALIPTALDPAPEPGTQAALLYLPAVMR